MIAAIFKDGTKRYIDDRASVTITFEPEQGSDEPAVFTLDDLAYFEMLDPEVGVLDGKFGGMPVKGLSFKDEDVFGVSVPIPLATAAMLADALKAAQVEIFRGMPGDLNGGGPAAT